MELFFGFIPVLFFLGCLFLLDSFKLVRTGWLGLCVVWGLVSAGLAYFVNTGLYNLSGVSPESLSRYIAPVSEEIIKTLLLFYLIYRRKAGFMIDAAIYGFAIGTGFALAENSWYYLELGQDFNVVLAIVRGFGTALMHGGATAMAGVVLVEALQRSDKPLMASLLGMLAAVLLHSLFNHFIFDPLLQTLLILLLLPLVFYLLFSYTTRNLQQWLDTAFSTDIDMLRMMRQGQFRNTRAGAYLASLREHFDGAVLLDMYCYFSLYLELSIRAKRNMLLRESGLPPMIEADMKDKLTEMKQLRRQIGPSGELALMPLVRMSHRQLWELNQLEA